MNGVDGEKATLACGMGGVPEHALVMASKHEIGHPVYLGERLLG